MAMNLRWRSATHLPVDGSPLKPETFRGLASADAARVPLRVGNEPVELGELFEVDGDPADDGLILEGDLRVVSRIGLGLSAGTLRVRGDVGFRFAAEMTGGLADLEGSCLDWAGAEMGGGTLRIRGDAGRGLGAAYPGSRRGMREGLIVVQGDAGDDAGMLLRRGLIAVRGAVGTGLGRGMIAGTIFACGAVGGPVGVGMKRGTLVLLGADDAGPVVPASFASAGDFTFPYLNLYQNHLAGAGFTLPTSVSSARLHRYNGDLASGGRGEILAAPARPVLKVVSPS